MSHIRMQLKHEYVSSEKIGRCYTRYVCRMIADQYVTPEQFWDVLGKPPGQSYWLIDTPSPEEPTVIDGVPNWVYTYGYEVDSSD